MAEPELAGRLRQRWPEDLPSIQMRYAALKPGERDEILAELERIPELERELEAVKFDRQERDHGWRAELGNLKGLHRQALAERDADIDRWAAEANRNQIHAIEGWQRAERLEAALAKIAGFGPEVTRFAITSVAVAALAPTPAEEGRE